MVSEIEAPLRSGRSKIALPVIWSSARDLSVALLPSGLLSDLRSASTFIYDSYSS
jgi:hypothetical protein